MPFVYLCVCYSFSRRLPQLRAAYCLVFVWLCRDLLLECAGIYCRLLGRWVVLTLSHSLIHFTHICYRRCPSSSMPSCCCHLFSVKARLVRPFSRAFCVFVRLLLIQPPFAAIARRLCLFGVCVALPGFTGVCWHLLRIAHTYNHLHFDRRPPSASAASHWLRRRTTPPCAASPSSLTNSCT